MDDALSVQISRVSDPEMRDALAALIAAAFDRSRCDPRAVVALAAHLRMPTSEDREPEACPSESRRARQVGRFLAAVPEPGTSRAEPPEAGISEACPDVVLSDVALTHPASARAIDPQTARAPIATPPVGHFPVGAQDAERVLAEAGRAWAAGDATRAAGTLRRLDPATLPAATAAGVRLLAGEIALRAAEPGDAVRDLLAAADLLAGLPHGPRSEADALVRAGEAICFLGDHFRYADITRRATRLGLVPPCDAAPPRAAGPAPSPASTYSPASASMPAAPIPVHQRPTGHPAPPLIPPPDGTDVETLALAAQIEGFGALFTGRYPQAVTALRRVVEAAELTGPAGLLRASAAALACGDDGAALRLATRAAARARAEGEAAVVPRALELKCTAELWRGAHDAAESTALSGARAAVDAGQPNEADNHLAMLALLAAVRGDRAACRWRLAQLHDGHGRPGALGRWALALLDLQAGRPQEAAARLGGIADARSGRGHVLVQVMAVPDLVEAAVLAGEPEVARAALTAFGRWAASTGEPLRRALSARCHALLARRGSAEADAWFREALRLHLAGESEFERARTQLLFGRDLRRRRRPGQAREQVGAALDAFVRCGARSWAEQARAELRVCGGGGARSATVPLTAQQLQIARLVADGATNREVAARLFLSTRTVDHHMRNIFHRLGISSRVALAKMIT